MDGVERLKWAADRQVGRNSQKLAEVMALRAQSGDLASLKALVGLAEGKKPRAKKRNGPSLAQLLAAEPEWRGPEEGSAEVGN
jgi:hypothetical protein